MKLVSFFAPGLGKTWGVVLDDEVVALGAPEADETLLSALTECGGTLEALSEEVLQRLKRHRAPERPVYPLRDLETPRAGKGMRLLRPISPPEVWGCGVTYRRSAAERDADADNDIYTRAHRAERPEIFFKAPERCCVGPEEPIGIRSDSALTAAEPELALVLGADAEIIGYTACNDVSAWDIERENPLYLPQSKTFAGCCALGPAVVTADDIADPYDLAIECRILRGDRVMFEGRGSTAQLGRKLDELAAWLTRCNPVPIGTVLTTGAAIMIPNEHALQPDDVVEIYIDRIGLLRNRAVAVPAHDPDRRSAA